MTEPQFRSYHIDPALRPFIHQIVEFEHLPLVGPRRELLVVGCPLLIFFDGDCLISEGGEPGFAGIPYSSFLAGRHASYTSSHMRATAGMQIDLTPIGAYALTGIPMDQWTDRFVHLDDVWPREGASLIRDLTAATDWKERQTILNATIRPRFERRGAISDEGLWLWCRMLASGGNLSVEELASALGWSRKRLRETSLKEFGFGAKFTLRQLRFRRAAMITRQAPKLDLSSIAAIAGYADQSHWHRDSHAFAGMTPAELRASLLGVPFFQDSSLDLDESDSVMRKEPHT